MSRFKVINLIDKIFITVSVFLIIYAWINFYIRDLWVTFVLSLIFSFACVFLLFTLLNKRNEKKFSSKQYFSEVEEKFLVFRLLDTSNKFKLLETILSKEYKTNLKDNCLIYEKGNSRHQVLIYFEKEKLSQFDLINLINQRKSDVDVLEIVCCDIDSNLDTKILKDLEVIFVSKKSLYNDFFLKANLFPDCSNLNTKKERKKFKDLMKNFFVPNKAKSYFLCGLILIFSSIILPYHYYYLIFGSTLLIFSVICKLQPFFK